MLMIWVRADLVGQAFASHGAIW